MELVQDKAGECAMYGGRCANRIKYIYVCFIKRLQTIKTCYSLPFPLPRCLTSACGPSVEKLVS